jgi:hypothetical protein
MCGKRVTRAKKYPYYICTKRLTTHECEQDYLRADLLEAAVVQDIKAMFRDEPFMARIWEEANRRLAAEKPSLEKEIEKVEALIAKARSSLDRYFEAFEAGALKPEICRQKVDDLNARVKELEAEKGGLETKRKKLELPAMDRKMLEGLLDRLEEVMASGTHPQQKDLIKRLVKKVIVHDRRTVEIWYGLPNQTPVRTPGQLAPRGLHHSNTMRRSVRGIQGFGRRSRVVRGLTVTALWICSQHKHAAREERLRHEPPSGS